MRMKRKNTLQFKSFEATEYNVIVNKQDKSFYIVRNSDNKQSEVFSGAKGLETYRELKKRRSVAIGDYNFMCSLIFEG